MTVTAVSALFKLHALLIARDPFNALVLLVFPLVIGAFLNPMFRLTLSEQGYADVNGAEYGMAAMAVMFSFLIVGILGFTIFFEHGTGTWERLRLSSAPTWAVLAGRALPAISMVIVQQVVVLAAGAVLFGVRFRGNLLGIPVIAVMLAATLAATTVALVGLSKTSAQLAAIANLLFIVFAGVGGALTPVALLPGWVAVFARLTPTYWAIDGYREVILDGGGLADLAGPVAALAAITVGWTLVAMWTFRVSDTKVLST